MASLTKEQEEQSSFEAYQENVKQTLIEHPEAIAHYECERKKLEAIGRYTKDFEPRMAIDESYSGEKMLPHFAAIVILNKPDSRCASGYFNNHPFVKWMKCIAKYTIASDGQKYQPRSYSLSDMYSDDGGEFYGRDGLYFSLPYSGDRYLIEYRDESDRFIEAGVCQKNSFY